MIKQAALLALCCLCLFVLPSNNPILRPDILLENKQAKVYFLKCIDPGNPQIFWSIEIKTPAIGASRPETLVLGDLYVQYVSEILSGRAYAAAQDDLNFTLECSDNGLFLTIEGSGDKADLLLSSIVDVLKNPHLKEEKFKSFKNALLRRYRNAAQENPIAQACDILKSILKDHTLEQTKAVAIKKATFEGLEKFTADLLNETFIEAILYNNQDSHETEQIIQRLIAKIDGKAYSLQDPSKEVIETPKVIGPFFVEAKTKAQDNVIVLAIENHPGTVQAWAAQHALMHVIKDPFFNELHTQQDAGDIILSQTEEFDDCLFSTFTVRSSSHDVRDLLARMELFFENYLKDLEIQVPKNRFDKIKASLITRHQQSPNNTLEMGMLLHKLAFEYDGDFDRPGKQVKGLQDLTYQDFLKSARNMMGKQNKERFAVLLKGNISEDQSLQYKKCRSLSHIRKAAGCL